MVTEDAESRPESDEIVVSSKKVNLKHALVTAAAQKRRAMTGEDVVSERVSERTPFSRLLSRPGGRLHANVVVGDSDPRDRLYEFDYDASDPFHYTDTDPTDPIGYPSDIILTDPW
jgi:hypothetical protein